MAGEEEPRCPFCEGRESETPPEVYATGPEGRIPDTPGWRVRVVPNRFPAINGADGRTEVVVHSPRHVRSMGELDDGEITEVANAWQSRARAARADGFAYVHAFVNEGRSAGGSLPHTHSQLVWLTAEPPVVDHERAHGGRLAAQLDEERATGTRVIAEQDGLIALCPYAGRGPYELLIAPLEVEPDGLASALLPAALRLLGEMLRRLRAIEGDIALNAWLHSSAFGSTTGHWHLEVLPRTTVAAGLELGAGIYVNPLPPEEAAERLR